MSKLTAEELQASLAAIRPRLIGFARLQLRSAEAAEDAVQDALLAAMEGSAQFSGASSFQTWVFSILKNKIVDELRRSSRNKADAVAEAALDEMVAGLFNERDHWDEIPAAWGDPHTSLEQKRFWEVLDACLTTLPASPARVFMMREFLDLETAEICKELAISTSNCWVLLHRARIGLRECLGRRWFGELET
ncbi:MAG: sigma-70 family RNA polymerase sigma factor [Proteobacteria bacterium]|nr:sigma-70 family RNA polymerase sigma factor [Pseudomonadota bacterium]